MIMNNNSNSDKAILYSFRRCPFAMRARAAIYFSKIKVELREVLLRDKPSEMLDISSKGTVPVLELEENILDESIDIMLWALNINDSEDILCPYREQKNFVLDTIKTFDLEFKYHLDRYKYSSRYLNEKDFLSREEHRNEGIKNLRTLHILSASSPSIPSIWTKFSTRPSSGFLGLNCSFLPPLSKNTRAISSGILAIRFIESDFGSPVCSAVPSAMIPMASQSIG